MQNRKIKGRKNKQVQYERWLSKISGWTSNSKFNFDLFCNTSELTELIGTSLLLYLKIR